MQKRIIGLEVRREAEEEEEGHREAEEDGEGPHQELRRDSPWLGSAASGKSHGLGFRV